MKIAVVGATGRVGRHVVELLDAAGHEVIAISRSAGVDVITGQGLAKALAGVDTVIDSASGPSPNQKDATEFFTTSARNLQELGNRTGVRRIIAVSIIGIDRFTAGYMAAKVAHEKTIRSGPIPAAILRAAQFHEFVSQIMEWGRQGDVCYVPKMRTQLVAARTVAQALAAMATGKPADRALIPEIAGPQAEELVRVATVWATARRLPVRIEGVSDPADPDRGLYESGALLPGPNATLAGPTFEEWLKTSQATPHRAAGSGFTG